MVNLLCECIATGIFLSVYLSFHISSIKGTVAWKNEWNASVLFCILPLNLLLFFSSSLFFFFLYFLAYSTGSLKRFLSINAFCLLSYDIFHCLVNLPRRRLSHPIRNCSFIKRSYLSIPFLTLY